MNQKETIRELTSKLSRCESQSVPAAEGASSRRPGAKNTMGDVSRGTTETLAQLGQTLQTLKQRLENLEVGGPQCLSKPAFTLDPRVSLHNQLSVSEITD